MIKLKPILFILLINFTTATVAENSSNDPRSENQPFIIENAWISEAPPNSKVMVAYLTITNPSTEDIELTSASSALYSSIEFHETVHRDGLARMLRHESIPISANSSVHFKRGGKHLMLFNPTRRLKAGDTVEVTLSTNKNQTQSLFIPVKKSQL